MCFLFQRLWHHQRGRISKCGREGTVKKRLSLAWYMLGISLSVEKEPQTGDKCRDEVLEARVQVQREC